MGKKKEGERRAPTSGPGASERERDARAAKGVVQKGEAARRVQVRPLGRSAGRAQLGRAVHAEGERGNLGRARGGERAERG